MSIITMIIGAITSSIASAFGLVLGMRLCKKRYGHSALLESITKWVNRK